VQGQPLAPHHSVAAADQAGRCPVAGVPLSAAGRHLAAEAQWRQLADAALAEGQAQVAERCYAALGDVSKTSFLRKVGGMLRDGLARLRCQSG
jgi:hypothetical protein